jgi:hypothetical protein
MPAIGGRIAADARGTEEACAFAEGKPEDSRVHVIEVQAITRRPRIIRAALRQR